MGETNIKILFVSPYPPTKDGIGTYSKAMITTLRAMGHEALVVLPWEQGLQSEDVIGHLSSRKPDLVSLCKTALAWNPDIIHVQFAVAAFGVRTRALLSWLRLIRSATSVPVIGTLHEVTRDTAALHRPGHALYQALAAQCDQLIVHTQSAFSMLTGPLEVAAKKVKVIPHPEAKPPQAVSTPADLRARFGLDDMELLVAFGFIHVDKGLEDLIRALGILRNSDTNTLDRVRLVVAGAVRPRLGLFRIFEFRDRLHLSRVLRIARAAMLNDNIVLTGYVPEDDVAAWFQVAAAVILPYRRTEQSGVASIANAFNVPVISSTAGGLGEQYSDSRWLFPPYDTAKLARVIARFLATPACERANSDSVESAADVFSIVNTTLGLYQTAARS
jgi:glycosyltransferase involved in cell wall biosynthesis